MDLSLSINNLLEMKKLSLKNEDLKEKITFIKRMHADAGIEEEVS